MSPLTRCGCDPLEAEHVFVDSRSYQDNGDTKESWRCVTCGAEWTDTLNHWELARRAHVEPSDAPDPAEFCAIEPTPTRGERDVVFSRDGQSCKCVHCGQDAILFNGVAECVNGQDCINEYGVRAA